MSSTPRHTPPFISPYPHTNMFSTHISEQHACLTSPRFSGRLCYIYRTAIRRDSAATFETTTHESPRSNPRTNAQRRQPCRKRLSGIRQLEEIVVSPHQRPGHAHGEEGADPRLRQERHGLTASEARAVQRGIQADHIQHLRLVQVSRPRAHIEHLF